ncbi:hypothetical protein KC19_2G136600 [Ceratodon purpureus]|uniref:Uncharacterized protein n=1 Tax=Ceratodon purpureus TaxID=3225 RepID=A0A8T0IXE4_CERPU|nr:hypothetical protein KC19_2G136600 [Ceratodon purpureus]
MECRKVLVEQASWDEYEVHVVVGSSSLYQTLRFALLASSWLPLLLGILVWSVVHLLLVVVTILMLLACVIFLLYLDILIHFFLIPLIYFTVALWDVVVLIMDTLRCIFVTIRVIVSCEATPGTATKVAYERIGGIRLFRRVRIVEDRSNERNGRRLIIPFMIAVHMFEEFWSGPNERGEAQEPGMGPGRPRQRDEPLKLQFKRWCEEIVPRYDVVSF